VPTRISLELCYVFPELKNEVFQLHKETEFPQKFFSVPFLSRKGTPVRQGRCQLDLKHAAGVSDLREHKAMPSGMFDSLQKKAVRGVSPTSD